jgi:glutaredoxin
MLNNAQSSTRLIWVFIASILIGFTSLATLPAVYAKSSSQSSVEKSEVVILTASWCHYCTKTRQYLTSNKIKFTEYDIEKSNLGYQLYRSLGGKGVPVIKVGENVMYGYNPEKLKQTLNESGYHLP